jgi:uroporphyrin-III C-methyltransferase
MGVKRVATIVASMRDAGFPADTPACAVQNGTLETQADVVTTLAELPAAVAASRIGSPAILVVGEVVRHARTAARATGGTEAAA